MVHCKQKNKQRNKKSKYHNRRCFMDMCVCENQNKTENSETEKSSNNPLPQNTTDTQIVPPFSDVLLLEICNDVWV